MTQRSAALVETGRAYIQAHAPDAFIASTTGGSVARGEADDLSDLDINIYVDGVEGFVSANRTFADEVIQIHVQPLPTLAQVRESAWGFRFLREAGIVTDPSGRYAALAEEALAWLDAPEGVAAIRAGALADIADRRDWAQRSLEARNPLEAGMASIAAMTDAAMLYRATVSGTMATATPLTDLDGPDLHGPDLPWRHLRLDEAAALLDGFAAYRAVLAGSRPPGDDFILDEVQVNMTRRKVERIRRQGESLRLGETLYHTIFWMMTTRATRPFAGHLSALPAPLQACLRRIGFDEPDRQTVLRRLAWADDLTEAADRPA